MKANLDLRDEISKIDEKNVLGSVESLPDQCLHAWEEASNVEVPEDYSDVYNIIMTGMGGSGLGARIIESIYHEEIKFPLTRINDYNLPSYANIHSLVVCSSYSGETEEPVQTAREAIERKCKWMAIGRGNTLIDLAKKHKVPYYQINPRYNPSNQPRMAIGYSVIGQLVLASKAGLFTLQKKDVERAVKAMKTVIDDNKVEVAETKNEAKKLARALLGKNIFYISARHLVGSTHTINNQLNENAKTFSADFQIPELNHHLMEGMKHPKANPYRLFLVFANSDLYPKRIQQRFKITMDIVSKNKIEFYEFKPKSKARLSQAFELIQFGGFVNLYLSVLYGQNPAPIPWVDYFKTKLGQPLGK